MQGKTTDGPEKHNGFRGETAELAIWMSHRGQGARARRRAFSSNPIALLTFTGQLMRREAIKGAYCHSRIS